MGWTMLIQTNKQVMYEMMMGKGYVEDIPYLHTYNYLAKQNIQTNFIKSN